MSDIEIAKGKLIPIEMSDAEAEQECVRLNMDLGYILKCYDSYQEALAYESNGKYAIVEPLGFCRLEYYSRKLNDEFWCDLKRNDDGSFDFHTSYYNGSCSWEEMVQAELEKNI